MKSTAILTVKIFSFITTPRAKGTATIFRFSPTVDFNFRMSKFVHLKRITQLPCVSSVLRCPFAVYNVYMACTSLNSSMYASHRAANRQVQNFPIFSETSPISGFFGRHKRGGLLRYSSQIRLLLVFSSVLLMFRWQRFMVVGEKLLVFPFSIKR